MFDVKQAALSLDHATTRSAAAAAMLRACAALGFDHYLVVNSNGECGDDCRIALDNLPEAFRLWCREKPSLLARFIRHAIQKVSPFYSEGQDVATSDTPLHAFICGAERHNLGFFLTAQQLTSPNAGTACIFLSCAMPVGRDRNVTTRYASWIACHAHDTILRINELAAGRAWDANSLTEAERTCLTLRAHGYDAGDIARIMGVSPRTITYYVDRSMRKLDARRPAEAVTKALLRREISTFDLGTCPWDRSTRFIRIAKTSRHSQDVTSIGVSTSAVRSARSLESLAVVIAEIVEQAGCSQFAVVSRARGRNAETDQVVLTNYTDEYQRAAVDAAEVRFNPMFGGGPYRPRPFVWERGQSRIPAEYSMPDGVWGLTAMVRSSNRISTLSLILQDGRAPNDYDNTGSFANQLVRTIHDTVSNIDSREPCPISLTAVEIECLYSLASGHGLKNAADILQCSTRMARYRMQKVVQKLGATSIAEGVACATELGLLPNGINC